MGDDNILEPAYLVLRSGHAQPSNPARFDPLYAPGKQPAPPLRGATAATLLVALLRET